MVWGDHGTARLVRDDRVKIVGKTGTAFPVENGTYNKAKRRYAFAGFFPYDKPRYSCMALVLAGGGNSANRTSGQVVKNIAIKMYSRGMLGNSSSYSTTKSTSQPVVMASQRADLDMLASTIHVPGLKRVKAEKPHGNATVPNVVGYEIADAVKLLEQRGLNVVTVGAGRVATQSILPGRSFRKGDRIILSLRI